MARTRRGGRGGRGGGRRGGGHGGGRGDIPDQGSVNTAPSVHSVLSPPPSNHDGERFSFVPEVKEALHREFAEMLKNTLPAMLAQALREAQYGIGNDGVDGNGPAGAARVELRALARGFSYESFKGCDPPVLDGKKDSVATYDWVKRMEATIKISDCLPEQAVMYVANSLRDEAMHWWDTVEQMKGEAAVRLLTWEEMEAMVVQKFCPQSELDKMEMEFLNFSAGTMTHRQYTSRFNELARLVPHLVVDEERRIKYYVQGLPSCIRMHVVANTPRTFESAVDLSGRLYANWEVVEAIASDELSKKSSKSGKRAGDESSGQWKKKVREETEDTCRKCGKRHRGVCRFGGTGCYRCGEEGHVSAACPKAQKCFKCGEPGHYANECPNGVKCHNCGKMGHLAKDCKGNEEEAGRPRARARAYAITQGETGAEELSGM